MPHGVERSPTETACTQGRRDGRMDRLLAHCGGQWVPLRHREGENERADAPRALAAATTAKALMSQRTALGRGLRISSGGTIARVCILRRDTRPSAVGNPSGVATPPKLDSARPVSPAGRIPKLQCARPVSVTSRLEFLLQTLAVDARAVMDGAVLSSSSHDVRSSSVRSI